MTRFRRAAPRHILGLAFAMIALPFVSACSDVTSTVTEQVNDALSGAVAPVRGAIDEAARRANEVGEGVNEVTGGIRKVKGAFSGSGSTW